MAMYANGNQVSGCTSYASAVNYIEEDGSKSTVQDKISELSSNIGGKTLVYNEETDCFGMINPYTNEWKDVVRAFFKEAVLIPLMTSNSHASGITLSASTNNSNSQCYYPFDDIESTRWLTSYQSSGWLRIKFDDLKIVTKFVIEGVPGKNATGTFVIQGSNDGNNFVNLTESFSLYTNGKLTIEPIDTKQYTYYQVSLSGATIDQAQGHAPGITYLQLYGQNVI